MNDGFRVLILRMRDGQRGPHQDRPWLAICQDRFPSILPGDDGFLPPIWGATEQEARDGMDLTIQERLQALGVQEYRFMRFETRFRRQK